MPFSTGRGSYRGNMGDRGQPVTRGKSTLNGKTVAAAAEEAARVAAAEEAARVAAAEEAARVAAAEEAARVAEAAKYATLVPAQEFVPYEERKADYFKRAKEEADSLEFISGRNYRNDEAALRYRNDVVLEDSLKKYDISDFQGGQRKKKKYTQTQTRQKKQHRRRRRRHSTRKHKK